MFMCLLEVLTASFFVGHGQMLPVPFTMLGLKLNAQLTSIMFRFISEICSEVDVDDQVSTM